MAWLLFANGLWGTSYVVAKVSLAEIPPPLLAALRFTIAGALLWSIRLGGALAGRKRDAAAWPAIPAADLRQFIGLGLIGVALTHLLSTWGISLTTATDSALMIVGEVIFTSLLAALIAKERLGRWKGLGAGIGIAGVVVLVLSSASVGGPGASWRRAAGDLLVLAALLGEALHTVLGTALSRRYRPLTVLTLVITGSLLVWLPVLGWYIGTGRFPAVSPAALGGAFYLGSVSSLLCFVIWFNVLPISGANMGAISLFAQPLVGAVLGLTVLGEPLTPGLMVGGCLVLLSLYCSTLPEARPVALADKERAVEPM